MRGFLRAGMLMGGILLSVSSMAQSVDITWGQPVDAGRKQYVSQIVGSTDDGFYALIGRMGGLGRALSGKSDKVTLQKCDLKANVVSSTELTFPSPEGKENKYQDFVKAGDRMYLFSSFYNKQSDLNTEYCTPVNNKGVLDKNSIVVDKISATKKHNSGAFSTVVSKDSSKILIYHDEPYEKNEPEAFNLQVYDKTMHKLWEKSISLPYKDKDVAIQSFTVSNSGNVYVLSRYQEGLRDKKNGLPNYHYFLLRYGNASSDSKQYDISLNENFITSITFDLDPKENFVCAGFYSTNVYTSVAGIFYMRINGKAGTIDAKNLKAFSSEDLAKFESKHRAKKGKALYDYVMRAPIIREDGGMVLMGEQYYVIVVTNTSSNGVTTTTYHYYYNTVLAANINANGNIDWVTAVPKLQHSVNDGGYYSSFAPFVYKDKIYLVFNDNKKNMTDNSGKKTRWMNNVRKSVVTLATIDNTGQVTKTALMKSKDLKHMYVRPKICTQLTADKMILVGEKRSDFKYGIMKFD
jgi:hypothetical protein